MDFFRGRYFNLNLIFLSMIGQWPYQGRMTRLISRIFIHIVVLVMLGGEICSIKETWGNLDLMIEAAVPIGVQLTAFCKSTNCIYNEAKMIELLETMKKNLLNTENAEENKILLKYSEQGRTMTLIYSIWILSTTFCYCLIPLVPRVLDKIMPLDNGTRPYTYLFQTEFYIDREEYVLLVEAHSYTCMTVVIMTIVAADTMYSVFIEHSCGLFAIVGYRLENLVTNSMDDTDFDFHLAKKDDMCYQELKYCIRKHREAIDFADFIENIYCISWLGQVGLCVLLMSITGVQLMIKLGQYGEMIRCSQFIVGQLAHLFFNSLPGQKLEDVTNDFRDVVYSTKWYCVSLNTRKLLSILMMRAVKPQKITAGKLYNMSMENFGSLVQTSVSYFTVFASFR